MYVYDITNMAKNMAEIIQSYKLSLYKVYSDIALLLLNGTSLNSDSAPLALNWRYFQCLDFDLFCPATKEARCLSVGNQVTHGLKSYVRD